MLVPKARTRGWQCVALSPRYRHQVRSRRPRALLAVSPITGEGGHPAAASRRGWRLARCPQWGRVGGRRVRLPEEAPRDRWHCWLPGLARRCPAARGRGSRRGGAAARAVAGRGPRGRPRPRRRGENGVEARRGLGWLLAQFLQGTSPPREEESNGEELPRG